MLHFEVIMESYTFTLIQILLSSFTLENRSMMASRRCTSKTVCVLLYARDLIKLLKVSQRYWPLHTKMYRLLLVATILQLAATNVVLLFIVLVAIAAIALSVMEHVHNMLSTLLQ